MLQIWKFSLLWLLEALEEKYYEMKPSTVLSRQTIEPSLSPALLAGWKALVSWHITALRGLGTLRKIHGTVYRNTVGWAREL